MRRAIITVLCIIMTISLCLSMAGCGSSEGESEKVKISDLKKFSAFSVKNELYTQDVFAEHDLTIVGFWAPWSDISVYEMGQLDDYMERVPENIQFITICFDGTEKTVKDAQKTAGFRKVPTLMSGDGDFKKVSEEVRNVPTVIIVDSKGRVTGDPVIGAREDLEEYYTKAINKRLKKLRKPAIELMEEATTQAEEETTEQTETEEKNTEQTDSEGDNQSDINSDDNGSNDEESNNEESEDENTDNGDSYEESNEYEEE